MTPRLRVIAGPNGSGKSTLANQLTSTYSVNLYQFLNSDILNAEIQKKHKTPCPFTTESSELIDFVQKSTYPQEYKTPFIENRITVENGDYLTFAPDCINSYTSAIASDFFKEQFLRHKISFSFETVFSHPSKVDILRRARKNGFRTYLYFIATENPRINIDRIRARVDMGGHPVPEDKTIQRYERCLSLVREALPCLNRAYFFDNTSQTTEFIAEYNEESGLRLQTSSLPQWFLKALY